VTPADFRLHDVLDTAAQAVAEAARGEQGPARVYLNAAREAAAAYIGNGASPDTVQALGLLLDAAGPARYRAGGDSMLLREALTAHAAAAITAMSGDRIATVGSLADAVLAAGRVRRLRFAFAVIRDEVADLARNAEVAP
jgi:hypothetical protein